MLPIVPCGRTAITVWSPTNWPDPIRFQYRLWGLATPEGVDPLLSMQYKQRIGQWVPFQTNRLFYTDVQNEDMLQTLGVRYVLVRDGAAHDAVLAASPNFRLIGRRNVFCHVYEYLHAKPPYHWEDERNGSVKPTAWIPERREFLVRSERGGRFVLIEQFFPAGGRLSTGIPWKLSAGAERFRRSG